MRVITGSARGVRLQTPPGLSTRPTTERMKEALFSAIQFDIEDRRVLDLFAGSGQLGIEALSRGARSCVFLDKDAKVAELVKANVKAARLQEKAVVLAGDAVAFLRGHNGPFDLAFLDPPYAAGLLEQVLPLLAEKVAQGGIVIAETDTAYALPEQYGALQLVRVYTHGKTKLWKYIAE